MSPNLGCVFSLAAVLPLALASGGGCGASRAAADAGHTVTDDGSGGGIDVAVSCEGRPSGTLTAIALSLPSELAGQPLALLGFDAATAGGRAWITAQTDNRITKNNGPALVYERTGCADWVARTLPATTTAFYPDLCAGSATEAYVALRAGDACVAGAAVKILARETGDAATFVEQPGPTASAGVNLASLKLACFPGGNLVAYGGACPTGGATGITPIIFRRASMSAAWVSVPLPSQAGPSIAIGVSAALVRADGSGYFAMSKTTGEAAIFERRADGSWRESLVLSPDVAEVVSMAGDPDGHAVGPTIVKTTEGYVELSVGTWSFVPAPGFRSLRAAALSANGLVLGGASGDPDLKMTVGREPGFAPMDLGLIGTVSTLAFPADASTDRPILIAYGDSNPGNAYEWTP